MSTTPNILNVPDTVVTDILMAQEMAEAAKLGYDELLNGGRSLSINRAATIGIEIGTAMEAARHKYLLDAVSSEVVSQSAKIMPDIEAPKASYDPAETRRMLVEQNVIMLRQTISSIFTTLRQADGSMAFGRTSTQPLDNVPTISESVTMYDPKTRGCARIYQRSRLADDPIAYEQQIDETIPEDGTEITERGWRGKTRGRVLSDGQSFEIRDDQNVLLNPLHHTELDTDPADLGTLLTRLTRSFPLSNPLCIIDVSGRTQREAVLDKALERQLAEDQRRYLELQN